MAGSLNHIVKKDGTFTKEFVECGTGDCTEALAECHQIIAELLETVFKNAKGVQLPGFPGVDWRDKRSVLRYVCTRLGFPVPTSSTRFTNRKVPVDLVNVPVIQPELHGATSVYNPPPPPKEWLIYSNEHGAWWRPNRIGYTSIISEAGRYTKAEADSICDASSVPSEVAVKAPEAPNA